MSPVSLFLDSWKWIIPKEHVAHSNQFCPKLMIFLSVKSYALLQALDEMADAHEQEKAELTQTLTQQGDHEQLQEALKALEKRQHDQISNKQAELDSELHSTEVKVKQAINEETNNAVIAAHKDILKEVGSE